MALKRAVVSGASLALALIVVGCFAAQLYQQSGFRYSYTEEPISHLAVYSGLPSLQAIGINGYCLLGVPTTQTVQTITPSQSALINSTRGQIFEFISANPGVSFRAICAALCLPVGLAEYHLGVLVKSGLVSFLRDGRYKRFFVSKRYSRREMLAICLLRHKTAKRILEALLHKEELSHGKLAADVAISPQALTWQMKTLTNTEFIVQVNDGLKTVYRIDESSKPQLKNYLTLID